MLLASLPFQQEDETCSACWHPLGPSSLGEDKIISAAATKAGKCALSLSLLLISFGLCVHLCTSYMPGAHRILKRELDPWNRS